ncbi:hypothetical protein LEN26_002945 [Aphanomyces euteiches]|nr:hypothetical protein LEN26_002945 [Aphanomyces euteiches]
MKQVTVDAPLQWNVRLFKLAVKSKCTFSAVAATELNYIRVYTNMQALIFDEQHLVEEDEITGFGSTLDDALVVAVFPSPRESFDRRLPASEDNSLTKSFPLLYGLQVHPAEFDLSRLSVILASVNPIMKTEELHRLFRGFPSACMVRKEPVRLWHVVNGLKQTKPFQRIVLVGSPGVGKSCFVILLALYLAHYQDVQVFIVRKVQAHQEIKHIEYVNGSLAYFISYTQPLVFLDGYSQEEVSKDDKMVLGMFSLLATSSHYDLKANDSTTVVALPAWRQDDLLTNARHTNWATETGLAREPSL